MRNMILIWGVYQKFLITDKDKKLVVSKKLSNKNEINLWDNIIKPNQKSVDYEESTRLLGDLCWKTNDLSEWCPLSDNDQLSIISLVNSNPSLLTSYFTLKSRYLVSNLFNY